MIDLIRINDLRPGMKTARNVQTLDGEVVLGNNVELTTGNIERIRTLGISHVHVKKDDGLDTKDSGIYKGVATDDISFNEILRQSYYHMTKIFEDSRNTLKVDLMQILGDIGSILKRTSKVKDLMGELTTLGTEDRDYHYAHGVRVCCYSVLLGEVMGIPDDEKRILATVGMLHDIGKAKITSTILDKKGSLNPVEMEEAKRHSALGAELLSKAIGNKGRAYEIVLQHHEREDGSGYPRGLMGGRIDKLAKIVAVADVFDAVTSDRGYKTGCNSLEAVGLIKKMKILELDNSICDVLIKTIGMQSIGRKIRLSDNTEGHVVYVDENSGDISLIKTEKGIINTKLMGDLTITNIEI